MMENYVGKHQVPEPTVRQVDTTAQPIPDRLLLITPFFALIVRIC
jgi:hypothetical protein